MRNRDRPSEEEKKGTLKVREGSNPSARDGGRGESETEKKIERERERERDLKSRKEKGDTVDVHVQPHGASD